MYASHLLLLLLAPIKPICFGLQAPLSPDLSLSQISSPVLLCHTLYYQPSSDTICPSSFRIRWPFTALGIDLVIAYNPFSVLSLLY